MKRWRMLTRILLRSLLLRPGRTFTALAAVSVAAAVITTMLTLYVDVQAKLHQEFRSYGANVVVSARPNEVLPADALTRVEAIIGREGFAAPFAYAVARNYFDKPVVVVGTDFARVRRLNSWWSVTAWPASRWETLVGARAARMPAIDAGLFWLTYAGQGFSLRTAGVLRTGGDEDDRIYLSLADFTDWTHQPVSVIEVSAAGDGQRIAHVIDEIQRALPQTTVQPVRQIVEAEASVFGKTRSTLLAAVIIIALTALVCLLATLTSSVLDRRRDFAIMKALGAGRRSVARLFVSEALLLGALGGIIGYGLGLGAAELIGWSNFHAAVSPRWRVLPEVLAGSMAVAYLTAIFPLALLRRLQPAWILKGE